MAGRCSSVASKYRDYMSNAAGNAHGRFIDMGRRMLRCAAPKVSTSTARNMGNLLYINRPRNTSVVVRISPTWRAIVLRVKTAPELPDCADCSCGTDYGASLQETRRSGRRRFSPVWRIWRRNLASVANSRICAPSSRR